MSSETLLTILLVAALCLNLVNMIMLYVMGNNLVKNQILMGNNQKSIHDAVVAVAATGFDHPPHDSEDYLN